MKKEPTLKAEFISKIHEIEKQKVIKVESFEERYKLSSLHKLDII